jgi:mannan endo-1,6-alpha-mannosidase
MRLYPGNLTGAIPGILPGPPPAGPYYWYQGGAMMATYIDYWHYTGDDSYNDLVMKGMLHQVGDDRDFQPKNHTLSLGNDDQGFWGMTAMLAAEMKFPDPPKDEPQWLALAQAVWVTMADPRRHDAECNGGMRWQIPETNGGYNYKNTIANGCFFNIGARLARYTDNATYAEHAEKTWDWLWGVNFIDHETYDVYDGGHVEENCTDIKKESTYSYNAGVLIQGAAFMYDFTNKSKVWEERVDRLTDAALKRFFHNGAAYEPYCEPAFLCDQDQLAFKGYLHRWLMQATIVAPFIADKVRPVLRKSAEAAAKQCTGGPDGRQCGFYWSSGKYRDTNLDKTTGAGEKMDALAAFSSLLVDEKRNMPLTNKTGGTSQGDPNAGRRRRGGSRGDLRDITTADRAGAGILTAVILFSAMGTFAWLCMPEKVKNAEGETATAPSDK